MDGNCYGPLTLAFNESEPKTCHEFVLQMETVAVERLESLLILRRVEFGGTDVPEE